MRRLIVTFSALLLATTAQAQVTNYATRADFNTASPGVPTETFGAMNLSIGTLGSFTGPLDASTNNSIFATGSVLSGFTMNTTASDGTPIANGSIYASNACCDAPTTVVSSNFFSENIALDFSSSITAFAIDVYGFSGNNDAWAISLIGSGGLIGTYNLPGAGFFGITSTTAITRVYFDKPDSGGVITNLSFGKAGAVPETGTWAMLIVGFGVAGVALRGRKRALAIV